MHSNRYMNITSNKFFYLPQSQKTTTPGKLHVSNNKNKKTGY